MAMTTSNPITTGEDIGPKTRPESRGRSPGDYLPLVTVVEMKALAAGASQVHSAAAWEWRARMHDPIGSVLGVPLSTVALIENLGMAALAAAMLFFGDD